MTNPNREQQRAAAREAALNFMRLFPATAEYITPDEFWAYAEANLSSDVVAQLKTQPYEMVAEDYTPLYNEWYVERILNEMNL